MRQQMYFKLFVRILIFVNNKIAIFHKFQMNQKKQSQEIYNALISSHPHIQNYFKRHVNPQAIQNTLKDLLLQAIHQRQRNPIDGPQQIEKLQKTQKLQKAQHNKHYQVAYVKQERFLSPREKLKERQNVTPKITEIVPITDHSKHVIYGKPRVRIQNQTIFPEDGQDCPSPKNTPSDKVRSVQKPQNMRNQQNSGDPQQEATYLKPAYKSPEPKIKSQELQKPIKQHQSAKEIHKNIRNAQTQCRSPEVPVKKNGFGSDKKPGKIRNVNSIQNYKNVKSKIKFLVEKDRNQRKVAEQLQKQNQKIRELERRQHYLVHHIVKEDERPFKRKDQRQYHQDQYKRSSSQNSCSSDSSSQIDEQLIRKYQKLRNKQANTNKQSDRHMRNCNDGNCDQSDSFSCSCSRTLQNISDSEQEQNFQKFDVKQFLANQRQYTPGYV